MDSDTVSDLIQTDEEILAGYYSKEEVVARDHIRHLLDPNYTGENEGRDSSWEQLTKYLARNERLELLLLIAEYHYCSLNSHLEKAKIGVNVVHQKKTFFLKRVSELAGKPVSNIDFAQLFDSITLRNNIVKQFLSDLGEHKSKVGIIPNEERFVEDQINKLRYPESMKV